MNKDAQSKFMKVIEETPDIASKFIPSIAEQMSRFIKTFPHLRGPAKLNKIEEMRTILEFLQHLCDGQFEAAQTFLNTTKTEQGETLLQLTVDVMRALRDDMFEMMNWSIDTTQFIYVLKLAEQTFSALSDFIQGPHTVNQEELLKANLIPSIANWCQLLANLSKRVRSELCEKLPPVSAIDSSAIRGIFAQAASKIEKLKKEELFELFLVTRRAESKLMVLLHSEIEQNKNLAVISQCLENLKPDALIIQFRYHWKASLFTKADLYTRKQEQQFLKTLFQFKGELGNKGDDLEDNIKKPKLSQYLDPKIGHFDVDQALTVAAVQDVDEQNDSIHVAFSYYVILETLSEFNSQSELFSPEVQKKLTNFYDLWTTHDPYKPKTVIPESEAQFFLTYFGRIEVVGKDEQLHRIYFPVPWDCREQMQNPLVKAERKNLMDNVTRDPPEEKLDDFLDRGVQIQTVIEHQHRILTLSRFKNFIRFLTTNEQVWILLAYVITIFINCILLMYSNVNNSEANCSECTHFLQPLQAGLIEACGSFHVFCAFLLFLNYGIGTARVTINTGYKQKEMIEKGLISLGEYGKSVEVAFETVNMLFPKFMWVPIFLFLDPMTFYYSAYLAFSFCGVVYSPYFFAFHVLDIAVRVPVLNYVVQAVSNNLVQVSATLLLGVILVYIFGVVAINKWGYASYSYGDGGGGWESLSALFAQQIDYGLRGPPVFDDSINYNYLVSAYDFLYNILIILIMVAIITGIIIDTFADMRQSKNEIEENTRNVCFICSLPREVFERHRIVFTNHLKRDHNLWNYIFYRMYLDRKEDSELNGMEAYLKDLMRIQSISYFPIKQALCLANMEKKGGSEIAEVKVKVDDLDGKISEIKTTLADEFKTIASTVSELEGKMEVLLTSMRKMEKVASD